MLMPRSKSSAIYYIVLLFILIVIIKAYFALNFVNPSVMPDEVIYSNIARGIIKYGPSADRIETNTPPGYPLFLSIANVSLDLDRVYHLMLVINCIISSSIIFPAFFILKKFIDEEEAIYFSLLTASLPSSVVYFPLLMSENVFIPIFLFSAWFMLESIRRKSFLFDFLFGFSIFMLYLTRAIGVVLVVGIVLALIYKIKSQRYKINLEILKSAAVMLLSFTLPFVIWYIYKANNATTVSPHSYINEFSEVSGYNVGSVFIQNFISAMTSFSLFIKLAILLVHEIDYLALVTYSAFLVFAIYSVIGRDHIPNKSEYCIFTSYVSLSTILLLAVTVNFMYLATFTGYPRDVLGRYLDPIVAPIFMMGVVGFYQFRKGNYNHSTRPLDFYTLTSIYLLILLTFVFSFPTDITIVGAHLLSIAYIILVITPYTSLFFTIASVLIFSYMLVMPKNPLYLKTLFVVLVLISFMISSFTVLMFYPAPNDRENSYHIARYLQNYASSDTLTLFDSPSLNDNEMFIWFPINFWSQSRLLKYPLNNSKICPSVRAEYMVSNKTLSYPFENITSDGNYTLYSINCG